MKSLIKTPLLFFALILPLSQSVQAGFIISEIDTLGQTLPFEIDYPDYVYDDIFPEDAQPIIQSSADIEFTISDNGSCETSERFRSDAIGSITITPSDPNEPIVTQELRTVGCPGTTTSEFENYVFAYSSAEDIIARKFFRVEFFTMSSVDNILDALSNVTLEEAERVTGKTYIRVEQLDFTNIPSNNTLILLAEYTQGAGPTSDLLQAWNDAFADGEITSENRFNRVRNLIAKLDTAITEGKTRKIERLLERIENAIENGEERGQVSEETEEIMEDLLEDLEDEYLED